MHLNPEHSSRSKLNSIQSSLDVIHDNPLNVSTSKMQYSIPRSKRWSQDKIKDHQKSKFYNLPDIKSNRSTSFGYGNKLDFVKNIEVTPSPLNYTIYGEFDTFKTKKSGVTFSAGRDVIKNVNTFGIKPYKLPGPQDYHPIKSTVQNSPPKYSMSPRLQTQNKWPRFIPGPGQYNTLQVTKQNNNLTLAKFESSPAISFGKDKRISQYQEKARNKIPGPGEYILDRLQMTATRFTVDGGRKFGKGERKGLAMKSITPGPGAYRMFSEFIH